MICKHHTNTTNTKMILLILLVYYYALPAAKFVIVAGQATYGEVLKACARRKGKFKIHQRGVQWKQGVVICMMLYTSLFYNTTPIHCTPLPLHPPVMNTQRRARG